MLHYLWQKNIVHISTDAIINVVNTKLTRGPGIREAIFAAVDTAKLA